MRLGCNVDGLWLSREDQRRGETRRGEFEEGGEEGESVVLVWAQGRPSLFSVIRHCLRNFGCAQACLILARVSLVMILSPMIDSGLHQY